MNRILERGKQKVGHVNQLKKFVCRDERVMRVVVVAEEPSKDNTKTVEQADKCIGYVEAD